MNFFLTIKSLFPKHVRSFFKKLIVKIFANYFIVNEYSYIGDGLATAHNTDFLKDKKFSNAYNKSKIITQALKNHPGENIHFRSYIACFCAKYALKIEGDFVECGVGKGMLSRTIVDYLKFEKVKKKFYLIDTFSGIPIKQAANFKEKRNMEFLNTLNFSGSYSKRIHVIFKKYSNVKIIEGKIPEILKKTNIKKISYLSIDMNNAFAEIESIKFFFNKITKGGIVLLDDYAYGKSFLLQKIYWDKFAKSKGIEILTLPTGQGLIIKT
jgi:O-methyltransferase